MMVVNEVGIRSGDPEARTRRQVPRIRLEASVEGEVGGLVFSGEATELSERGLCLTTPWRVASQQFVRLNLAVPRRDGSRETCLVDGEIVRSREDRLTIAFTELKAGQLLRIRDFVWRAQQSGFQIERRVQPS